MDRIGSDHPVPSPLECSPPARSGWALRSRSLSPPSGVGTSHGLRVGGSCGRVRGDRCRPAYTGGPWPYGYHGLGEVFVFAFFGLAGVVGNRFVHDATLTQEAWLLAIPVGFLVTAILVANNVRDIDTDRTANKRTLAVILGRRRTIPFPTQPSCLRRSS